MNKEKAIPVLIVDDHAIFRAGVRAMLEEHPDIHIIGEARNGLEATAEIMKGYPETSIIGLSVDAAAGNQEAITRAGAIQLLSKETVGEELYKAICKTVANREPAKQGRL